MTLIFSGNDYKYELEGVMKLFIPATLFTHVFSDSIDTEDDYVFAQTCALPICSLRKRITLTMFV